MHDCSSGGAWCMFHLCKCKVFLKYMVCSIHKMKKIYVCVNMGPQTLHFWAMSHLKREALKKCSVCTCIARFLVRDPLMPKHDVQYEVWCDSATVCSQSLLRAWSVNMHSQRWLVCTSCLARHMTMKLWLIAFTRTHCHSVNFRQGSFFEHRSITLRNWTFAFAAAEWGIQTVRATLVEDWILDEVTGHSGTSRGLQL